MKTRVLAQALYVLSGTLYLVVGGTVLLFRTGLLPAAVKDALLDVGRNDLNGVHLLQEEGCLLVFAGLMTFWFLRHYGQSLGFHWAMTAFWGLMAVIHWFDVRGPTGSVTGPLINSLPFLLFAAVGLVTLKREPARGRKGGIPGAVPS